MEYSTIKPYTNAKGVSHDAHFNANGKYIGSVKKMGSKPIKVQKPVIAECMLMDDYVKKLEFENSELRKQISNISRK